jgi:N-methylhydantoinase A
MSPHGCRPWSRNHWLTRPSSGDATQFFRIYVGSALQIGPQSAGASPGPVCYDRGGTEPTATDADVVLGYLNPDHLVGGAVKLDAAKARSVIEEIARSLDISTEEAAWAPI